MFRFKFLLIAPAILLLVACTSSPVQTIAASTFTSVTSAVEAVTKNPTEIPTANLTETPLPAVHPDTITVGTEQVNITTAEGNGVDVPTVGIDAKGGVFIKNGETWTAVDLSHMETSWSAAEQAKIPTLLAADKAGDRASADNAPVTEWHEDSAYKRNEILQILKASGTDVTQFNIEGKSQDDVTKINDSLFDTWITWNEQHGIKETSAPESLIAAVVNRIDNVDVGAYQGADKLNYGIGATGNLNSSDLQKIATANQKSISVRGETFIIYVENSAAGADGKQRTLLHRVGYPEDQLVDVISLGNGRNNLIMLVPNGATSLASDICAIGVTSLSNPVKNCDGQSIDKPRSIGPYPMVVGRYLNTFPELLAKNSGVQVRWLSGGENFTWMDGIGVADGFYSSAFK